MSICPQLRASVVPVASACSVLPLGSCTSNRLASLLPWLKVTFSVQPSCHPPLPPLLPCTHILSLLSFFTLCSPILCKHFVAYLALCAMRSHMVFASNYLLSAQCLLSCLAYVSHQKETVPVTLEPCSKQGSQGRLRSWHSAPHCSCFLCL